MSEFVIPNSIWNPQAETMPRRELQQLQLAKLKEVVRYAGEHVGFYREAFAKAKITPDSIRSLDDIRRLPFTTKANLRENYPFKMLAVPKSQLARIHASSGTTGKPTFCGYTKNDLNLWSELCARFLVAGGLKPEHIVQIAFGYGLFTGGFGLHYGIEKVGAAILPISSGNTDRQIMMMQDIGTNVLICTPSYALNLAEVMAEKGIRPCDLQLQYAHFGGEQWTESMRQEIERRLHIHAFNNYGLSEIIGPGVSGECAALSGMHCQEDHFIFELINPETLEPVKPGEQGEMVITALSKEAMPIIRYRTRDLTTLDCSPCPCGRTTIRMGRVIGRSDDMLIIRGVNVFPSQIEEALLKVEGVAPQYLIEVTRPGNLDQVVVKVEVNQGVFSDQMSEMQKLKAKLERQIQTIINIHANVELVQPNTLERSLGKAKRVIDHRNLRDQ